MSNATNFFTTILRYPEKDVPEDYLRKVLAVNTSCGGYALQTKNEKGEPHLISDTMDTAVELGAVQELLSKYPDGHILLTFGKVDKVEGDLQPANLEVEGFPYPLLSFALEGDFPSMVEAGLSEEAKFAKTVIFPNLNKFLKYSGGDLDKFIAELKDPTFTDSLMARIGDRGTFCFLPPVGDPIWLGKNKLGSAFPWGMVSHTYGYAEKPMAAPAAKEEVKKSGWWGAPKAKGPSVPVAEEKVETKPAVQEPPVPEVPQHVEAPPKPDTKITPPPATPAEPPKEAPKGSWQQVPTGLSKDNRKKFIRRVTNCGANLPDKWNVDPFWYFQPEYEQAPVDLNRLKEKFEKKDEGPKDMRSSEPPKKVEGSYPQRGSDVAEVSAMVLSADEKSSAETAMLGIFDRQGKNIPSPTDILNMVKSYPTFTKQFGIKMEQIHSWLPADLEAFAKKEGKAFFHLTLELIRRDAEHVAKLKDTAPGTGVVVPETPVADEPKKVANAGWSSWGKK